MDKETIKVIIISTLFMYIGLFDYSSVTVVLPQLSNTLHISSSLTNWISISFLLFCTASGLSFGTIVPKYGVIKVAKISTFFMIIGALISTLILNPGAIIIARSIQGLSAAALFIISYLLIIRKVEENYVGSALGIVTGGGFLSSISAPIIGGTLSYYFPPQCIFSFSIPFSIICLILLFTIKEEWCEDLKIDILGTGIWFITMISFIYGVSYLHSSAGITCLISSIILLIVFVIYELEVENPLYDFRLLKNLVYSINNYAAMMACFVKDGMVFVLTLYLQYTKCLSSIETGFFISILAVIMLVISPIAGKLSDTINSVHLANFGSLLMLISTILICLIRYLPSWSIMLTIVFLAIGYGLFDTPNKKIILKSCKESELSYVTAFLSTIRDFGMLIPTALFTLSLSLFANIRHGPKYWASSSQFMFELFFIVAVSILVLSLYTNKNLEIIYKFDFRRFAKPITNTVGELIETVEDVPSMVIDTVSEVPTKVAQTTETIVDTVTETPEKLISNAENITKKVNPISKIKNKK